MSGKKTYLFQFPNADSAGLFLRDAQQYDVLSHHPSRDGQSDDTQVLVQRTGSLNFDLNLLASLSASADNLGGTLL